MWYKLGRCGSLGPKTVSHCHSVTATTRIPPYGVYCLPPAPGEHVEPAAKPPCPADGPLHWAWRLREDEGLVFVGQAPPLARYFGFRNYVFSRKGWLGRRELFASLGDSLNLKVISTAGTP